MLLGFEHGGAPQLATIVLNVENLDSTLGGLSDKGISPERRQPSFAVLRDPEGREVIFQA